MRLLQLKNILKEKMRILKNNKELQVAADAHIGWDIKVKNARGKKSSWIKSRLKNAARHLRKMNKKININEDNL